MQLTIQPQEIELWYVLPALRRDLSKALIAKGLTQKEIARKLGVTEAAVSQYLHSKRAQKVRFGQEFASKIKTASDKVVAGEWSAYQAAAALCREFREGKALCALHRSLEKVPQECDICMVKV